MTGDENASRQEILELMFQKENRPGHVAHVSRLALQLFDGLQPLHGLGARERLLLEAAAHLHDIGHGPVLDEAGHHKESARLIRVHPWKTFDASEVEIIAQVSRYHRKSMPEMSHDEFRNLPEGDRRIVQHLAAMLRIADSLDRTHEGHVRGVRVELPPNRIAICLESTGPIVREVRAAYRKADLAVAVFQRDVVLMQGDEVLAPVDLPGA